MGLNEQDLEQLGEAKRLLETISLAARLTDLIGKPIELGVKMLPRKTADAVHGIVRTALERARNVALATMGDSGRAGGLPGCRDRHGEAGRSTDDGFRLRGPL